MTAPRGRERHDPVVEDEDVELGRLRIPFGSGVGDQGPEADEVVRPELLDLLPCLAHRHILYGERVHIKRVRDDPHVPLAGIVDIQPPNVAIGLSLLLEHGQFDGVAGQQPIPGRKRVDSLGP